MLGTSRTIHSMDREWTAVGDRRANKARKSLGKNPAVSVCYLISDALDHNCYYETTTAFYTLATTDTFVELAKGIPEHILSSSTSLVHGGDTGVQRSAPASAPADAPIPNSPRADHRVQMQAGMAVIEHAARDTTPGLGASARAAGGTCKARPAALLVVAWTASLTRSDQRPLAAIHSEAVSWKRPCSLQWT